MKTKKRPSTVDCYNCKRRLNFMQHLNSTPGSTVESERVRLIPDTLRAGYTIFCTCEHYMVFRQPSELRAK